MKSKIKKKNQNPKLSNSFNRSLRSTHTQDLLPTTQHHHIPTNPPTHTPRRRNRAPRTEVARGASQKPSPESHLDPESTMLALPPPHSMIRHDRASPSHTEPATSRHGRIVRLFLFFFSKRFAICGERMDSIKIRGMLISPHTEIDQTSIFLKVKMGFT